MESVGRRRWSMVLGAVAALLVLVPIVIGLALGSSQRIKPGSTAGLKPVARTVATSALHNHAVARASAPATVGRARTDRTVRRHTPAVQPDRVALVAVVRRSTTMRVAPAGRPINRLSLQTPFGSPQVLWVVERAPGWLGVISPIAGNGRVGWIPRAATSLSRTTWELRASLSSRKLTVIEDGKVLRRYTVAIGAPDSPTPTGRFAVTDRLATHDASGPYGCCIVALSALAPHAIQGWDGGNRIAIHSTPGNPGIGKAITHGCLHLTMAEARWLLYHVPLGTPTMISA